MSNKSLTEARKNKQDEFYTKLGTVEQELNHYKEDFKNKIVYCNCDDPYESNFFKYFFLKFKYLGLKKLITTSYAGSTIVGTQLVFEDIVKFKNKKIEKSKIAYKVEIDNINDLRNISAIHGLEEDVKSILKHNPKIISELKGDGQYDPGDFRSKECVEILKNADIVVTNPPFPKLREYFNQLMKYKKKFLILANINALVYNDIFPLLKEGEIYTGFTHGSISFVVPDHYKKFDSINENGKKEKKLGNICWLTNLFEPKNKDFLTLTEKYTEKKYPKYLGYDAIEVKKLQYIPMDYGGEMGVPLTIFQKLNHSQFKIVGLDKQLRRFSSIKLIEIDNEGNPTGKKADSGKGRFFIEYVPNSDEENSQSTEKPKKHKNLYKDLETGKLYKRLYARIVIKARK